MTTRQQAIFNPAQFKAPSTEENDQSDQNDSGGSAATSINTKKEYPVTGNATRDQVRKLIFESFAADQPQLPNQQKAVSQLVEEIENDIFDECKDSKSKQYRDKSRAVQVKLKGSRFEQTRNDLRCGRVQSKIVIRDDYVQGKTSLPNANPVSQMPQVVGGPRPPMMVGAPRPQLGMRPPGPGGPMMRPRFAGPAGGAPPMFRPPPVQMEQLPPQPIEEPQAIDRVDESPMQVIKQATVPFDDAPLHISRQSSEQQRDSSPVQQQLHPQPPSSTDVHTDERPQLDQEDENSLRTQNTYPLDTSSNLLQTSADNIGASIDDDQSLMNPGKKKGKKKKKKGKKPGDGSQDMSLIGADNQDGGNLNDEDHPQQISVIEEEKEESKTEPEESGLRAQILSEIAPISGVQNDEILNLRKQLSEEFVYPTRQEEEPKNITILPGTIDERMIGIPSSFTNSEMRSNPILRNDDAEEEGSGGLDFRKTEFDDQGSEPEIIQVKQLQNNRVTIVEEELKQDLRSVNQRQNRMLNDLYEDEDEQVERRGILSKNSQDQTGNQDQMHPRQDQQDQPQRFPQDMARQSSNHLGTRTSSVKSLHSQQPNLLFQPASLNEPAQASNLQNDTIKRLQDAITYKRAQKKELSEQLVHLENNSQLQTRKATMLLEENKVIRSELRQKDREIQNLKMQQDLSEQQLKLQIKTLERQLREKTTEIDQLKKEAQRRKEKDERSSNLSSQQFQQLKDRQAQSQSENDQQMSYLQNLLRSLDQRIQGGQGSVAASSGSNNNASSLIEGAGASNYQQQEQMMESVQKEMREMKQLYESRMRELNEQLQDRMRNLQRVERQNVQLMEKNIRLSNLVQNMEVQQLSTLSTVAGSGSNQRDAFLGAGPRGMRANTEEGDETRQRQPSNNNNHPGQGRFYQIIGENDEGTGGLNQNHQMRNQQEFGYGEDGMAAPVVSGGGAMGAGGGVGTTATQLYNNDAYDDDEGFNEGNNQMRGGSGGVGSVNMLQQRALGNNISEVIASGGGQHMIEDVEEDEDQDLEEEGDEEDIEEERDDDYDHQIEGEGDYEGGNGGVAGAGGLDEEDQDEADEDALGMDEEDDGFGEENQHNIEEDAEGGAVFDSSYPEEGNINLQGRVKGAARGLRTHHNHNMQGSGHSHSNSQSAHYIDASGSASSTVQMIDGGSYSSFVPPVSGGAGSTRLNPVRAAGPAAAGNTRRSTTNNNNEERKGQSSQGPRRGNKQQNQQHNTASNNATGSGGSSNMQNPRQRNTRGRQLRSNQQHVQQPLNQTHNVHEGLHANSGTIMMPGATPSSNINPRGAGSLNHEYFQSYGDSSTHYNTNNNNSRDQSITQQNLLREGAAGGGVVHTVSGSRNTMPGTIAGMESSMMSAESGSTALLDRGASGFNNRGGPNNNLILGNQTTGVASMGGQARGQSSSIQHLQANQNNNQQQFQPMQYLGTAGGQSVTDLFSQDSSSAAPNNDSHVSYTAAVGAAPIQSRAAAPRQQRHQQHQQNNQQNAPISYYQGFEESKNESNGNGNLLSAVVAQSSAYSNNNQVPTQQQIMRNSIAAAHSGSQNNNQAQMQHNQYSMLGGSSGEQEEDSYSGIFSGGAGSGMMAGNHIAAQYGGSTHSNHGTSNGFERGRNQQPQNPISGSRLGFHHEQSHNTPTRNDSRKTSGANTPNKDGADTPTTKAYRHQQNPFVQVHNLTSSHLFFNSGSNQDESENPFSNNITTNQQQQQQTYSNQQQQQFGRGAGPNLGGGPSGGGIQEADVINGSLFDS